MRDKLQDLLAQLRFHGMAAALDAEIERTEREATPASELLYRLLCQEAASRRNVASSIAWIRPSCHGRGRLTPSPSTVSRASTRHRSKAWPTWNSYVAPTMSCWSGSPEPEKPALPSDCCAKLASMATAAVSTALRLCSMSSTLRWPIGPPRDCSNV